MNPELLPAEVRSYHLLNAYRKQTKDEIYAGFMKNNPYLNGGITQTDSLFADMIQKGTTDDFLKSYMEDPDMHKGMNNYVIPGNTVQEVIENNNVDLKSEAAKKKETSAETSAETKPKVSAKHLIEDAKKYSFFGEPQGGGEGGEGGR